MEVAILITFPGFPKILIPKKIKTPGLSWCLYLKNSNYAIYFVMVKANLIFLLFWLHLNVINTLVFLLFFSPVACIVN